MRKNLFTKVDYRILTATYPISTFDTATWNRLFQLFSVINFYTGSTIAGRNKFREVQQCGPATYERIMKVLEQHGIISRDKLSEKLTRTTLYVSPVSYNGDIIYQGGEKKIFNAHNTKDGQIQFVMVPKDIYDRGNAELDPDVFRLLLLLFRHSSKEIFGGVDPNLIFFNGDDLQVSRRLMHDMGMGIPDILSRIDTLIEQRYVQLRDVCIETERMDMDIRYMTYPGREPIMTRQIVLPLHRWTQEVADDTNQQWPA